MIGQFLILSAIGLSLVAGNFSLPVAPQEADNAIKQEMPEITEEYGVGGSGEPGLAAPTDFGQAYQVYGVDFSKAKTNDSTNALGAGVSIISAEYVWEYPLLDASGSVVGSNCVAKSRASGEWEHAGLAGDLPIKSVQFSANEDEIRTVFEEQGVLEISEIKHFRISASRVDFIYAATSQGEYIFPLNWWTSRHSGQKPHDLELQDKKVYPAADVFAKIIDRLANNPNISASGLQWRGNDAILPENNELPAIAGLIALMGVGGLVFVLSRKRLKKGT